MRSATSLRAVRTATLAVLLLLPLVALPRTARGQSDSGLPRLEAELQRLIPLSAGKMGIGVVHLETGRELFLNGDEGFPMASTFKVPIAVQFLTLVDQGKARLDSIVSLKPSDLHPGSSTLSNLFDDPGVSLSLRNMIELMLLISDNSATDIMLKAAGGAGAVNARLAALDVSGISVNRPTIALIADAIGVKQLPPESEWNPKLFQGLAQSVSETDRKAAAAAFYKDPRDTATPRGMARLLEKIWMRQALSETNSALLLDIMYRCQTGQERIKGMLPPNIPVAHKTGTLGLGVAGDVGIVDLPGDAGHVIIVAYVKESTKDTPAQEKAIAQVARAAYDYFVFNK